jgi:hypothetical protein
MEMTPLEAIVQTAILAYHKVAVEPLILKVDELEQQLATNNKFIDQMFRVMSGKRLHD